MQSSMPRVLLSLRVKLDKATITRVLLFAPHKISVPTPKAQSPKTITDLYNLYSRGESALGNKLIQDFGITLGGCLIVLVLAICILLPSLESTLIKKLLPNHQIQYKSQPKLTQHNDQSNPKKALEVVIELEPPHTRTELAAKSVLLAFDPQQFVQTYLQVIPGMQWTVHEQPNSLCGEVPNIELYNTNTKVILQHFLRTLNLKSYIHSYSAEELQSCEEALQKSIPVIYSKGHDILKGVQLLEEEPYNTKFQEVFHVVRFNANLTNRHRLHMLYTCRTAFRIFYPCITLVKTPLVLHQAFDTPGSDTESKKLLHIYTYTKNLTAMKTALSLGMSASEKTGVVGRTPLHIAALHRNSDMVRLLAYYGASLDARDVGGRTPLHVAVGGNNKALASKSETVATLLQLGAKVDVGDVDGNTAFAMLKVSGEVAVARVLLEHGANLLLCNNKGTSAVLTVSMKGTLDKEMDALLQKHGAVKNALYNAVNTRQVGKLKELVEKNKDLLSDRNVPGWSALHLAAYMDVKLCEQILDLGGNIELPTTGNWSTPLHIAANYNAPCTELLLKRGANVHAIAIDGRSPLHNAAVNNQAQQVRMLVQAGSAIDLPDNCGDTPLLMAWKSLDSLKVLIELGANLQLQNKQGLTILHAAITSNNPDMVAEVLKAKGADSLLAITDTSGNTPLHIACKCKDAVIATMLINFGADVNLRTDAGTPIVVAADHNNLSIVNVLLHHSAGVLELDSKRYNAFINACIRGNVDMVSRLIEAGAVLNPNYNQGFLPLHTSINNQQIEVAKLLVEKGASLDTACGGTYFTPIHNAAKLGLVDMVQFLLQAGASKKATAAKGETILHLAAQNGHLGVVKDLVSRGVELEARDNEDNTPLLRACESRSWPVVKTLINGGAKWRVRNMMGETPLHKAAAYGGLSIAVELLSLGAKVRVKDDNNRTPLQHAIEEGHPEVVTVLLEHHKGEAMLEVYPALELAESIGRINVIIAIRKWEQANLEQIKQLQELQQKPAQKQKK